MLRLYKINSKVYITRNGIAVAYYDLKRFKYVKAPTHLKDGYSIIITTNESSDVRPDITGILND